MGSIKKEIISRVLEETYYIIDTKTTVRDIAKKFKVSKSTVHKDFQERLLSINKNLYNKVKEIMEEHIKTRHIKGGESTRLKYENLKKSFK